MSASFQGSWPTTIDGERLFKDSLEQEWGHRAEAATVSLSRFLRDKVASCPGGKEPFGHRIKTGSNCTQKAPLRQTVLASVPDHKVRRRFLAVDVLENATLKVVNAGLGKTGTHAFHQEMCAAGLKSVHWNLVCNGVPHAAVEANLRILRLYTVLKKCAAGEYERTHDSCNAQTYVEKMRRDLTELLSSGVEALSDSPYTDYVPFMLQLVPRLRVVQTLRDPEDYAQRRLHWISGTDTLCKDPWASGGGSYWDTMGCLSDAKYVADALTTNREAFESTLRAHNESVAVGVFATKFVMHSEFVARRVKGRNFAQVCVWDSDHDAVLDGVAKSLLCDD